MPVPFIVGLLRLGDCLFDCFNFHSPYDTMQNGVICAHEQLLTVLLLVPPMQSVLIWARMHPSIFIYCIHALLWKNSHTKNVYCVHQNIFLLTMKIAIFILSLMPVASAAAETRPWYRATYTRRPELNSMWCSAFSDPSSLQQLQRCFWTQFKKQMGQHLTWRYSSIRSWQCR